MEGRGGVGQEEGKEEEEEEEEEGEMRFDCIQPCELHEWDIIRTRDG